MQSVEALKSRTDTPVITLNANGLITYINIMFTECYGWTCDDLLGKPLSMIIPVNMRDAHNLGFSRFLVTETPTLLGKKIFLKILTKDGVELSTEHLIVAEKEKDSWKFAASINPVNFSCT